MRKILKHFKGSLIVFLLLFSVLSIGLTNPMAAKAEAPTPRFNFLQGDAEMLRGAHKEDSTWTDPISASIGDRIAVLFYYHNGVVGSVAHHTKLRVDLPIESSEQLILKSYLWSQETQYIADTVVNGQVVGKSGLTINVPGGARVEYVPGSTKWFPNGTQVGTQVPDGIVSASGLDIGDINGCWQYAGYVTFLVDIKGCAQLVMDKKVAHPNDATWFDEITAYNGDEVIYHLGIRNEGDITAKNVTVMDQLPTGMSYIGGTTKLFTKTNPAGVILADTMFSTGISLPDILPGQENVVYITYKTKIKSDNSVCNTAQNNVAAVYLKGIEQDMDQAKVTVICKEQKIIVEKKVWNGTAWVDQNSANLGDTLQYQIKIKNTGNTAVTGIKVRDILPVYVNYLAGSTKVNGSQADDAIVSNNGLLVGNLDCGQEIIITLCGKIYGCPPVGCYTLLNTAYVYADNIAEITATAKTILNLSPLADPGA